MPIPAQKKLSGYQRLEQDFFRLCKIRNIKYSAMMFFIYLRGLYCRFGQPMFYYTDDSIKDDLNISLRQIGRLRKILQERGVIEYIHSKGRGKATQYSILKTELAPVLKQDKLSGITRQIVSFYKDNSLTKTRQIVYPIVSNSKEQSKKSFYITPKNKQKLTDKQRNEMLTALRKCKSSL